jgi:hypothetical protein
MPEGVRNKIFCIGVIANPFIGGVHRFQGSQGGIVFSSDARLLGLHNDFV